MINIHVCVGSACHLKGSYNVISALQQEINDRQLADEVTVKAVFCLGHCTDAVSVRIDEEDEIFSLSARTVERFILDKIMPRIA